MPFVLFIIAAVCITSGVRGTQDDLFGLVKGEFTGPNNFIYWVLAIMAVGSVGYIPTLQKFSRVFIGLIIVVLILKKGTGFFDMFSKGLSLTQLTPSNQAGSGEAPEYNANAPTLKGN